MNKHEEGTFSVAYDFLYGFSSYYFFAQHRQWNNNLNLSLIFRKYSFSSHITIFINYKLLNCANVIQLTPYYCSL